jgi:general secretion pathway protein F
MPVFEYKALDKRGRAISGIVTADGPSAARMKLAEEMVFPINVQEISAPPQRTLPGRLGSRFKSLRTIAPGEVSVALRQLATLVSSGLPLVDCLNAMIDQTEQSHLKKVFVQIRERVLEGESLSKAMSEHPSAFNPIFVNMIKAAEIGGALDIILGRLADFSEHRLKLQKKLSAAMTYPLFMVMVSTIILIFLMSFVMPKVLAVFEGMDLALPWFTRALIWIVQKAKQTWWIWGLAALGGLFTFSAIKRTERGIRIMARLMLHLPVLGSLHQRAVIARFTRTLAILLRSGLPLVTALEAAKLSAGNRVIEDLVEGAARRVGEGADFASTLKTAKGFPPIVVQLVRAGEQGGELEAMLEKAAEIYEQEVESRITSLTSIMEPAIILVMGAVIAFIVMAILMPIFEMSGSIR